MQDVGSAFEMGDQQLKTIFLYIDCYIEPDGNCKP